MSEGPPDPIAQAIADIHTLGEEMGFRRLRVDRSGRGGTDDRPDCFFEVGYGCREIKVRTYAGNGDSVGIYRCDADEVSLSLVVDLLAALIDETENTRV